MPEQKAQGRETPVLRLIYGWLASISASTISL